MRATPTSRWSAPGWPPSCCAASVYAAEDLTAAIVRLDEFLDWGDEVKIEEVSRLVGTVRRWRPRILAYHHRRLSNGRSEAMIIWSPSIGVVDVAGEAA